MFSKMYNIRKEEMLKHGFDLTKINQIFNKYYLNKKDRQMRFNNGGDPIYAIFDKIDERPLSKIAKDFVKELKDDSIRFISTLLK